MEHHSKKERKKCVNCTDEEINSDNYLHKRHDLNNDNDHSGKTSSSTNGIQLGLKLSSSQSILDTTQMPLPSTNIPTPLPVTKKQVVINNNDNQTVLQQPTMGSIVYMLCRGNRIDTLKAVKQLIKVCCGVDSYDILTNTWTVKLSTMKEMRAARTLQTLLSTFARCSDWNW